jgi:hypothetical protein
MADITDFINLLNPAPSGARKENKTMKTETLFESTDRYAFDFKLCTIGKGWAQVDTSQDASYFGTWANPFELKIVNYCEGDIFIQTADNIAEFKEEIHKIKDWNEENGHKFHGIDPGFNERLQKRFEQIGLSEYLH